MRIKLPALLAVVAGMLALPAGATTPDHCQDPEAELVEPVELCDGVVLEASQTGYVRVSAPKSFSFSGTLGAAGAVNLEGNETVGFVLTRDPPAPGGFVAFRLKYPSQLAGSAPYASFGCSPSCQLSAGNYRLYLIAGSPTARVTLDFGSQFDGVVELPITHFPESHTTLLPPRMAELPTRPVNSAGETRSLRSTGLVFSAVAAFHPNHVASRVGRCLYYGDPGDPEIAYLPDCPSPFAGFVAVQSYPETTVSLGPLGTRVEGVTSLTPDTYGVGTWYESVSTDTTAASLIVWLTYD